MSREPWKNGTALMLEESVDKQAMDAQSAAIPMMDSQNPMKKICDLYLSPHFVPISPTKVQQALPLHPNS